MRSEGRVESGRAIGSGAKARAESGTPPGFGVRGAPPLSALTRLLRSLCPLRALSPATLLLLSPPATQLSSKCCFRHVPPPLLLSFSGEDTPSRAQEFGPVNASILNGLAPMGNFSSPASLTRRSSSLGLPKMDMLYVPEGPGTRYSTVYVPSPLSVTWLTTGPTLDKP